MAVDSAGCSTGRDHDGDKAMTTAKELREWLADIPDDTEIDLVESGHWYSIQQNLEAIGLEHKPILVGTRTSDNAGADL